MRESRKGLSEGEWKRERDFGENRFVWENWASLCTFFSSQSNARPVWLIKLHRCRKRSVWSHWFETGFAVLLIMMKAEIQHWTLDGDQMFGGQFSIQYISLQNSAGFSFKGKNHLKIKIAIISSPSCSFSIQWPFLMTKYQNLPLKSLQRNSNMAQIWHHNVWLHSRKQWHLMLLTSNTKRSYGLRTMNYKVNFAQP